MDKFNIKHIMFVLFGVSIVSLKVYPTVYMKNGGRDTWIVMIVASIVVVFYLLFAMFVFKKSNYSSFHLIYEAAVGKVLGKIFVTFFMINLFLTLIESSSVEANAMNSTLLLKTPQWLFLTFFIPPALYVVKKGKASLITTVLICITFIMLSGLNLAIMTLSYKHIKYLLPILKDGFHNGLLLCFIQILGLYGSLSIVFPYLTEVQDNSKMFKWMIIGILHVIQILIVATTGTIMTFQVEFANTIYYPKLLQTQLIQLFQFLELGELFVLLQIVGGFFVKYILTLYAIIRVLESGLNINKKNISIVISILVFIFSYFVSKNSFLLFKMLNYYSYISLINFFVVPLLMFSIYAIKGYPTINNKK